MLIVQVWLVEPYERMEIYGYFWSLYGIMEGLSASDQLSIHIIQAGVVFP